MASDPKRKKTPERILDNAQKLMLREGYKGVSVDSIIEATGVSKGTFFYHFESKEALAKALVLRFISQRSLAIKSLMDEIEAKNGGNFQILIHFLEAFPSLKTQHEDGCLLAAFSYQLMSESPEIHGYCQEAIHGWKAYFRPYIKRAFDEVKVNVPIEHDDFASMVFCLMEGAYIVERMHNKNEMQKQFSSLANLLKMLVK